MYGVTLAHFIFENNLREILLCFTLSLQLKKTPRNPPLSLSLFSDCCTTQLKRDPRRAAGDIYKCSRRRRSMPPPPASLSGQNPGEHRGGPQPAPSSSPPEAGAKLCTPTLELRGGGGKSPRSPGGCCLPPRRRLPLARPTFIHCWRRPEAPPLLFSPPHLHLSPGRGGRRRSQ